MITLLWLSYILFIVIESPFTNHISHCQACHLQLGRETYILYVVVLFNRGRTGVFVCGLLPNSAAMECGKISIGDQIIEVNGVDMRNATVDEAADIMVSLMPHTMSSSTTRTPANIAHLSHAYVIDD